MKTQLLEDIGESHPQPDISPSNDPPAAGDEQQQAAFGSPQPQPASRREGLWRPRAPDTPPAAEPPLFAAPSPPPPPAPPEGHFFNENIDPLAEVWAIANPDTGPTWFDRWGRRAAASSSAALVIVAIAGGAAWMYRESRTDQALASLASATQYTAAVRTALRYVEPIDVHPSELALDTPEFIADVPDFAPTPEPVRRVRSRPPVVAKVARKPPPPPPPARPDPAKARADRMAETLRQCRAAGYHAEQCVKRACVATPYGIACKG